MEDREPQFDSQNSATNETDQSDGNEPSPWTEEEAGRLAEAIHLGTHAMCPRCRSWVQGTILGSAKTIRKPVELECEGCGRHATSFGPNDNEGKRVPPDKGWELEEARKKGSALDCPLCGASMRLLRDELPGGREIFAFDCHACGASYYEAGGVL